MALRLIIEEIKRSGCPEFVISCTYRRQRELQLLACHGLQRHGEVKGRDAQLRHLLERIDKGFFGDADFIDPYASDGEVRVRLGDVIPHVGDSQCCR